MEELDPIMRGYLIEQSHPPSRAPPMEGKSLQPEAPQLENQAVPYNPAQPEPPPVQVIPYEDYLETHAVYEAERQIIVMEDEKARAEEKMEKGQANMERLESDLRRLNNSRELTPYDRRQVKLLQEEIGQYDKYIQRCKEQRYQCEDQLAKLHDEAASCHDKLSKPMMPHASYMKEKSRRASEGLSSRATSSRMMIDEDMSLAPPPPPGNPPPVLQPAPKVGAWRKPKGKGKAKALLAEQ